jgi:signal transduction histidine kinase
MTSEMKLTKVLNEKQFQDLITATVSHDMKTPLNSIIASCEEIKPYTKHNKRAERLRKINLASSRLLLSLVNDLLDLF